MSEKDDSAMEGTSNVECDISSKDVATLASIMKVVDTKPSVELYVRFKKLLRNPKSLRWFSYEWFYSCIDKPLAYCENKFQMCLQSKFPKLKTRKITLMEWRFVRRVFGKPRRFSYSFIQNERRQLQEQRKAIRLLQLGKSSDETTVEYLPDEIPLMLYIGARVTARLISPNFGFFSGTIKEIDFESYTYKIRFDEEEIGTQIVPDYEVASHDYFHATLPLMFLQKVTKSRMHPKYHTVYESDVKDLLYLDDVFDESRYKAESIVKPYNTNLLNDEKTLCLITNLANILLVSLKLATQKNDTTIENLEEIINEVSENISLCNLAKFERCMQVHFSTMKHFYNRNSA